MKKITIFKKETKWYFNCWWLFSSFPAITIGNRVFCKYSIENYKTKPAYFAKLKLHEGTHVLQYEKYSIPGFWFLYITDWIINGFRYSKIKFEVEAKMAEMLYFGDY